MGYEVAEGEGKKKDGKRDHRTWVGKVSRIGDKARLFHVFPPHLSLGYVDQHGTYNVRLQGPASFDVVRRT